MPERGGSPLRASFAPVSGTPALLSALNPNALLKNAGWKHPSQLSPWADKPLPESKVKKDAVTQVMSQR